MQVNLILSVTNIDDPELDSCSGASFPNDGNDFQIWICVGILTFSRFHFFALNLRTRIEVFLLRS